MNEQDKTSSQPPATPQPKKQPVAGAAIQSRPAEAKAPETAAAVPKPAIESTLVGDAAKGKPAAARKAAEDKSKPKADTAAEAKAAASSTVPASGRPDPKSSSSSPSGAPPVSATTTATTSAPAKVVEVRRGGFLPLVLGGVVAAGLGAGATFWAIPHLPPEWRPVAANGQPDEAGLAAARDAAVAAARSEVQAEIEALRNSAAQAGADAARQALADLPAAPPGSIPPALEDRIAGLERGLTDVTNRLQQQPAPASAPTVDPAALDELRGRLDQQAARIEELAARPTVDPATAEQVQTLASQARELQQSTEAANRQAQAATAAAALATAFEAGAPRDQALADLAAAGIEVPEVLKGEIPRLVQLRAEFPAAARAGLRASLDAVAESEGTMGLIGNFLRVQTGARSVEPREGSDPDAILSRANAAVEAGAIATALDEIATLPQSGQNAMKSWTDRARIWVDANTALAELAAGGR
ncbi:COG4223 family protein [Paracoccus yeei]|uniref:COG4223 family protein n=1 Tax=Paracoccus yeei TaxID=147645 RepID=UPI003BF794C7